MEVPFTNGESLETDWRQGRISGQRSLTSEACTQFSAQMGQGADLPAGRQLITHVHSHTMSSHCKSESLRAKGQTLLKAGPQQGHTSALFLPLHTDLETKSGLDCSLQLLSCTTSALTAVSSTSGPLPNRPQ